MTDIRDQWEARIEKLTAPIKFSLSFTPSQRSRLDRIADDKGISVPELIQELVVDYCNSNIGQAVITSPSWAQGKTKITGFSNSVTRG